VFIANPGKVQLYKKILGKGIIIIFTQNVSFFLKKDCIQVWEKEINTF
jgi:hypothetical protein